MASPGFQHLSLSERWRCAVLFYNKCLPGLMVNSLEPVRFTGGLQGFLHYVYACHGGWLRWQLLEFKWFFLCFFSLEQKGKGRDH